MTAKEYLQQAYLISRQIKRLQARRIQLREDMFSLRSPSDINPDKVQTSLSGDNMIRLIAKVDQIDRAIEKECTRLMEKQTRIEKEVESVPYEQQRDVLYRRYILFQRWEQIAVSMNVSLRHVYRIHGEALQTFSHMHKDVIVCH